MEFMQYAPYIWDGVLCIVILTCVSLSAHKGFIKSSKGILALILTALLITTMQPVMMDYLENSSIGENIQARVSESIVKSYEKEELPEDTDTTDTETSLLICKSLALPKFLSGSIEHSIKQMSEVKNNVMDFLTETITETILKLLSIILLFILVRFFVFLILKLLESLFELPGLRNVNRTLGALIGVVNALLTVYIICGAVGIFVPVDKLAEIQQTIDSTLILKYFYDNNLLLSLFI